MRAIPRSAENTDSPSKVTKLRHPALLSRAMAATTAWLPPHDPCCGKVAPPLSDSVTSGMARYLLLPSTLILLAANLVPLIGVFMWGWDAFVLLVLYWLETAVIAFWTVVRIATMSRGDAPAFVEVGEAGIAVDHAMRRQLVIQRSL